MAAAPQPNRSPRAARTAQEAALHRTFGLLAPQTFGPPTLTAELHGSIPASTTARRGSGSGIIESKLPTVAQATGAQTNPNQPPLTKIIASLGPSSKDKKIIKSMLLAGMNVARFNFSHGTHDDHVALFDALHEVTAETKRICAVLLDTKGPEIRTGILKEHKDVQLTKGQEFNLVTDTSVVGDNTQVSIDYPKLPQLLKPGSMVFLDGGLIKLQVVGTSNNAIKCKVLNSAELHEFRNLNAPGVTVDLPTISNRDLEDIKLGMSKGIDFVAVSYASKAQDIADVRDALGVKGRGVKVIAKIENQAGLDRIDELVQVSDGILISRGKLGVDIPIDEVSLAQKMIIHKCNAVGKFVITATQMLDSMIKNPSPTRAEASDVANAVFDGSDCVMLSGETAIGLYPVESVRTMADICREAETFTDYQAAYQLARGAQEVPIAEAIASAAVKSAFDLRAALLVVLTETGRTASFVAKYRPPCRVLTITASEQVARQTLVWKGLFPLLVGSMIGTDSLVHRSILAAKKLDMCQLGDRVIITSGVVEGVSGTTNMLKIVEVNF